MSSIDGVLALLEDMRADACVLVVPGRQWNIERSEYGPKKLVATSMINDVEMDEEAPSPAHPPPQPRVPSPLPPPPVPVPVVPRSSARQAKRKQRYGIYRAASPFRSAPPLRKASIDPSMEMGVPAYLHCNHYNM